MSCIQNLNTREEHCIDALGNTCPYISNLRGKELNGGWGERGTLMENVKGDIYFPE